MGESQPSVPAPADNFEADFAMGTQSIKVLVVEDDLPNRFILQAILQKEGYEVIHAENGQEAVELFQRDRPDLVLMDIKMPVMDGYEATKRIKAMSGDVFVPVIFLTATSEKDGLVKCVESGGDDFLTKPYNPVLLQARIDALMRIRDLYSTVHRQRDELAQHQKRLDRERMLAKRLFTNIVNNGSLDRSNIKYMLSPMSLFSGDILLAAPKPSGGLHAMLGDFTGHGLAAATGALPVSSIFYGMTAKGYSIGEIVAEINIKLRTILPIDMFLAACVVDMDHVTHKLSVWNGGIPVAAIYGAREKEIVRRIHSRHLPLGIVDDDTFNRRVDVIDMREGDRLYICSDGLTEAQNPHGEMFGIGRLEALFEANREPENLFEEIRSSLADFQAGMKQQDDVTLLEIAYEQDVLEDTVGWTEAAQGHNVVPPATWSLNLQLGADIIRHLDPLPVILQSMADLQGFRGQRQYLHTVFSELYTNALDHGVLGLNSLRKKTAEGFAEYYRERETRLANLKQGFINFRISHAPHETGGELVIRLEDSGPGFDFNSSTPALDENRGNSGRGIQLLRSMCQRVTYFGEGNIVEVVYRWR
jgi:CheY-like chemotaxis protein